MDSTFLIGGKSFNKKGGTKGRSDPSGQRNKERKNRWVTSLYNLMNQKGTGLDTVR